MEARRACYLAEALNRRTEFGTTASMRSEKQTGMWCMAPATSALLPGIDHWDQVVLRPRGGGLMGKEWEST